MNQSKLDANSRSWCEARENVRKRVTIGFGFTCDWLRKWREFFKPITKNTDNPVNQSNLDANTRGWCEARENVRERVTIGFSFTSDWLRKWRAFFKPITKRSNAKPK